MSKRGGKHENYDAKGMWHGMKTYYYKIQFNVHDLSHSQDMTSIGYYNNRKLYQLKPIEFENMIKGKDVTNTKFHQAS